MLNAKNLKDPLYKYLMAMSIADVVFVVSLYTCGILSKMNANQDSDTKGPYIYIKFIVA